MDMLTDFDLDLSLQPDNLVPWQSLYPALKRKPIRLSYSTLKTIHSCPRKFRLLKDKSLEEWDIPIDTRQNNINLDFGTAMGIGTATYILFSDLDMALWAALCNFNFSSETTSKNALSLVTGLSALDKTWDRSLWKVATFNGKPAIELSFKIILDEETQDYYCGYVDVILQHRETEIYIPLEVKTTGIAIENIDPLYQNSAQALGYSLVLDAIAGTRTSWQTLYLVYQFKHRNILPTLHINPYLKTLQDRLEWLLTLRLTYNNILSYYNMNYWPKHGDSCLLFNKACPLFGVCDLDAIQSAEESMITKEVEWDFIFTIDELIERSTGK